ncbi:substrate-binding domain-containing protein [Nonomuraea rhizosphaerae]|uniref:substrate-binding domain-containing protein n=1 Tax=Nonomuraea rhizosphaerae TaxID=2665663 RepID=UPI001C5DE2B8|nr:substrate-binding domain-containing protein [Nonomuraea rhizosphaerae]
MSGTRELPRHDATRRGFLAGSATLGAASLLAACSGGDGGGGTAPTATRPAQGGAPSSLGKRVTIGFSSPGADHGWVAEIGKNARKAAESWADVELLFTESNANSAEQVAQVETLINRRPDVLVILPQEGQALTAVARKAMDAGIPVVNLDRIFDSPLAYRTWVGGDNYGMGAAAGDFIGRTLKTGSVVEIQGISGLQLTKERSQGFADALKKYPGVQLVAKQAANFTPDTGEQVMSQILQGQSKIGAVWTHDDDQGVGVEAAIRNADRQEEMFLVGGGGTKAVMTKIKAGSLWRATALYLPTMSGTAVNIARLIAQDHGLSETWEFEMPNSIQLVSSIVDRTNVDRYLEFAF